MSTKNNPGWFDCYSNAGDDEPMFVLLGRDRHAAALVELWAFMREKEGESGEVVAEARSSAESMRAHALSLGKPVLNLDSLLNLAASLTGDRDAERVEAAKAASAGPPISEGDLVTARGAIFNGTVGRVSKVLKNDPLHPEFKLDGQVNVVFGRGAYSKTVTMAAASLRHATPDEALAASGAGR